MNELINFWVVLPLIGFLISVVLPKKNENLISQFSFFSVGLHMFSLYVFLAYWIWQGHPTLDQKDWVLFTSSEYEFFLDFCFDKITAVYAFVGSTLTFLVAIYSRTYMHREPGFKRFFNTILFFNLFTTIQFQFNSFITNFYR